MTRLARRKTVGVALRRAWFGVGPVATARAVIRYLRRADAEAHRPAVAAPAGPHPFDLEFSVQTGGFVGWRDLQSGGRNDPYISGYFGTVPSVARRLIGVVANPADYVFIDLGCGKGRAAIIASERRFRCVIGVEIAATLATTAEQNAATIRARYPGRSPISIVHRDAAEFELPRDPLVLFLYQPFERPVMRVFLDRLAASLSEAPRSVIVLYHNPALAPMLDATTFLERRADGVCEPSEGEKPFSYGGRGGKEAFAIWTTRNPRPAIELD